MSAKDEQIAESSYPLSYCPLSLYFGLKGAKFLDDYPDWKYDGKNAPGFLFDHDEAIENALIKMVVSPPDTTGEQRNKGKWLAWWAQNKNTAQFAPRP